MNETKKVIKSLNMHEQAWEWLREMSVSHKCSMSEFCQDVIAEASGRLNLKRQVFQWKKK